MMIFWFKEAIRIFGRAKSSFILSLTSLSISIILITVSAYSILLSQEIEKKMKEQFILNIFLNDTLSTENRMAIKSELEGKNYTSSIIFIDKDAAADAFIKDTGEDFRKILDYNPIPASFSLKLKSDFVNKDSITNITEQINIISGIDEILFENELLDMLVTTLKTFQKYIFIITAILILISIYITYSTIKFVVSLKREELETMKLIGAKMSTIKMPIILNELLTGFLASILSFAVIKLSFSLILKFTPTLIHYIPRADILFLILLIGPVISFLVSIFVLRKITLKI